MKKVQMTAADCLVMLPRLSSEISVLMSGPTGVGKSHVVYQIAEDLDLPVIDRRLAQMTEGDILGLPSLEDGTTRFLPVDWIRRASTEPVCLFLDELNRASLEVQQCAFQLVLDREINGVKLHPQTRIFAAINEGSEYKGASTLGAALMRRFFALEFVPDFDIWMNWARTSGIHGNILAFFEATGSKHWNYSDRREAGSQYPSPASWHRLSDQLHNFKWPQDMLFQLTGGLVGVPAATDFADFCKTLQRYTWKDLLGGKKGSEKLDGPKIAGLIEAMNAELFSERELTDVEMTRLHKWSLGITGEMFMLLTKCLMDTRGSEIHQKNLIAFHAGEGIKARMVEEVAASQAKGS